MLFLSFLGVLTHTPMDWLNVYGARFWVPFDGAWSYGDALFIVDPWLWLILGGAVFLARAGNAALWTVLALLASALMLLGPVPRAAAFVWLAGAAVALGLRRWRLLGEEHTRRRAARLAVAAAGVYVALMAAGGAVGERWVMAAARDEGLEPLEAMVSPAAANPFAAEVEVVTRSGYVPGELRWLPRFRATLRPRDEVPFVRRPEGMDPDSATSILAASRAVREARDYLTWSRYPHAEIRGRAAPWEVRWSDARYDDGGAGGLSGVIVKVPATR